MAALTDAERLALVDTAAALDVAPAWLYAVIDHESRWNPAAANPTSSARGLLQWLDRTAEAMGYASSDEILERHPSRESQLRGPVLAYLRPWKPFPSLQSLALSVFYPAFRHRPESTAFPGWVTRANPGIRTIADYMAKVRARLPAVPSVPVPVPGGVIPAGQGLRYGLAALVLALVVLGLAILRR